LGDVYKRQALQRRGALASLWLIAALVSIIGGRVIPFFTQRGLNRAEPAAPRPRLDLLVLLLSLSLALLFAHTGAEPGHQRVLKALQAEPLLDLGLRLGEGSGAA
ncbi:nicotinate-nucleotide--dimethylbenzimidazole phosphoribosyltransferase, partial [Pseudomonas peli]|uniref:nicotinate-nucleotide--dimethylbenzimidazole phosphoribosyltransferase n=1 Tax=Pseudomonas peli TaxID=592361 RepID=UPI003D321C72